MMIVLTTRLEELQDPLDTARRLLAFTSRLLPEYALRRGSTGDIVALKQEGPAMLLATTTRVCNLLSVAVA